MKKYCTECGQPTEYTSSLPKFCQGCGTSFNLLAREKAKASKVIKAKKAVEAEDEDEDDDGDGSVTHIPNLSQLDVEIETSKVRGISLKDVMGTAGDGYEREAQPKQSKEEFLMQFKKEAGSIRNKGSNE